MTCRTVAEQGTFLLKCYINPSFSEITLSITLTVLNSSCCHVSRWSIFLFYSSRLSVMWCDVMLSLVVDVLLLLTGCALGVTCEIGCARGGGGMPLHSWTSSGTDPSSRALVSVKLLQSPPSLQAPLLQVHLHFEGLFRAVPLWESDEAEGEIQGCGLSSGTSICQRNGFPVLHSR